VQIISDVGPPPPPRVKPPTGAPDVVATVTVSPQQALWYRLSGDYNAIHVDPEAAKAAGLERPILHGLCSLGIAARQILLHFCREGLSSGLVSLYCRFSKAVLPGDVLEVKMWERPEDADAVAGAEGAPAAPATDAAAMGIVDESRSGSSVATTSARRRHHGLLAPHRAGAGGSSPPTKAACESKERSHEGVAVIRFEVCSPRLGGAVVVADGRAVVRTGKKGLGEGEGVLEEEAEAPRNRARL
ncbi:unnamed protein product, partial [Ectocarpus fasciculatus]